jgi:hypothetical protein
VSVPLLAPFGAVGCKRGCPPHEARPDICARGHRLPGHAGPALVTGERSEHVQASLESTRREISLAVLRDAGHSDDDAPEALRRVAVGFAQAVLMRDSAFVRVVEAGGPMTSSDRARRAFDVWLKSALVVERHARTIGLRRVPKPTVSPLDYLAGRVDAE